MNLTNSVTMHHNISAREPPPFLNGSNAGHVHHHTLAHTAFYWGKNAVFLFSGWPGKSSGMYALALVVVFMLAVLVEFFTHVKLVPASSNRVAKGFFQTGIYGLRVGLAYMVMLSVISYNVGVFIAAMIGHAAGFAIFGFAFKN
ncbi:hypothetical protein DCAR_0311833 [Daucus carota subsp. sativus]|uniref:Copper transport protein n=1 Tax=Daucus carota subsp. sativus TaxID=79200 RepID=A0A166ARC2_DAUCS|nr:PREDICTED: copper transporter 1-like [Daucus carota subsp. sativus]WOG92561.1 hypothetical protein DCAR_0311833 [Daucus carota subsp. sativus]